MNLDELSRDDLIRYGESFSDVPADVQLCNRIFQKAFGLIKSRTAVSTGYVHELVEFVDSKDYEMSCPIMANGTLIAMDSPHDSANVNLLNRRFRLCKNPPCGAHILQIIAHAFAHICLSGKMENGRFTVCGQFIPGTSDLFRACYCAFMKVFLKHFACEEYAGELLAHSFLVQRDGAGDAEPLQESRGDLHHPATHG